MAAMFVANFGYCHYTRTLVLGVRAGVAGKFENGADPKNQASEKSIGDCI